MRRAIGWSMIVAPPGITTLVLFGWKDFLIAMAGIAVLVFIALWIGMAVALITEES